MDSDLRNKLSRIVVKSFLLEVLKDGELEDSEKGKLRRLLKATKLPKVVLSEIQNEVREYNDNNFTPEGLDEYKYFKKLKELLEYDLDPKSNQAFLQKIAKIIDSDEDLIVNYIPALFKDSFLLNKSHESNSAKAHDDDLMKDDKKKPQKLDEESEAVEVLDSLILLREAIPNETKKYFEKIVLLKSLGKHGEALEELLDYSNPLGYGIRHLLLSRIYYEIHDLSNAKKCLEKAEKSGISESILLQESYFHQYEKRSLDENIRVWRELFKSQNYVSGTKSQSSALETLKCLMLARNKNILAVELMEYLLINAEAANNSVSRAYRKDLHKLFVETFSDIYFKYYGIIIVSLQLIISSLVVGICLYHVDYIGPAFFEMLKEIVSGISNWDNFLGSFKKVGYFVFLIIALLPVCYVNAVMLLAGIQGKTKSYTQLHGDFIKICDFGKVYNIAVSDPKKPIFLYQDDNDYTYVSLVRHLPLIPNFTYIYGYDHLRKIYCLLPLYGIADGYLFDKQFLRKQNAKVYPLNMLGVRLAQAATVVAKISRTYFIVAPLIIFMGVFLYAFTQFSDAATSTPYVISFTVFLLLFVSLVGLPKLTVKLLSTKYLNFIFSINIIKPGLLLLLAAYLSSRYYPVYDLYSLIPVSIGLYSFYLLFVRTKYPSEKKQIVAQVSASNAEKDYQEGPVSLGNGLRAIFLGVEKKASRNALFLYYNKEYIALSRKIFGLNLYYDVVNITANFNIYITETLHGTKLRISTYNYEIDQSLDEVKNILRKAQLPFTVKDFTDKNSSKIAVNQLGVCLVLASFWHFGSSYINQEPPFELSIKAGINSIAQIEKYLEGKKSGRGDFWHKAEQIPYELSLTGSLIHFHQKKVMTWYEYESSVQRRLLHRNNKMEVGIFKGKLPKFIRADNFRDDIFDFFGWHLWTKWQRIDAKVYGNTLAHYCEFFDSPPIENREGEIVCSYSFSYQDAIDWIVKNQKVPKQLEDMDSVLLRLLNIQGDIIRFYPKDRKNDKSFVLRAVAQNGRTLEYASSKLVDEKDVVLRALKQDYTSHEFMGNKMWNDPGIMRFLLSQDGTLLKDTRTPDTIRGNSDVVEKALKSKPELVSEIYDNQSVETIFSEELLDDELVVKELLRQNGLLLGILSPNMQNNEKLVKLALKSNGMALEFAPKEIQSKFDLVKIALEQNALAHKFMDSSLWDQIELLKLILTEDGMQLQSVTTKFRENRELTDLAISNNSRASQFMNKKFWGDSEIVEKLMNANGLYLEYVDQSLKSADNIDIIKTAVGQNGLALKHVPEELRSNKEILNKALREDGRALKYVNDNDQNNTEHIHLAAANNLEALDYVSISKLLGLTETHPLYYAYILENGNGVKMDLETSKDIYKELSENNPMDPIPLTRLGHIYLSDSSGSDIKKKENRDNAWDNFQKSSELGDPEGYTMLGYMKEQGWAVNKNLSDAKNYYLRALVCSLKSLKGCSTSTATVFDEKPYSYEGGYAKAAYLLGKLFTKKLLLGPKQQGRRWLEIAAEQEYLQAQKLLSKDYFEGIDGARSLESSFKWLFPAAEQGDLASRFTLGLYYYLGIGISQQDMQKATEIFGELKVEGVKGLDCLMAKHDSLDSKSETTSISNLMIKLAERGSTRFQCLLGSDFNIQELNIENTRDKKLKFLKQAADNGDSEAQIFYARHLRDKGDYELSKKYRAMAEEQNNPRAYTMEGEGLMERKYGYDYNQHEAVALLKRAANRNEREAQRLLGMWYADGSRREQAEYWFEKAANNGDDLAMLKLGLVYESKGNDKKAVEWYKRAERLGNKDAVKHLRAISASGAITSQDLLSDR